MAEKVERWGWDEEFNTKDKRSLHLAIRVETNQD